MSGITDPSEEYFKDGLWGWVVNQWKKLIADAAGHLQVDVVTSGLPAGGATAANQATMITALQLIDDLTNALNSIATDELDVVFDGQNVDVEVTQTTPADLCTGAHGWDGSVWRKLPLVFGYSDIYHERVSELNATVTSDTLAGSVVPAGQIWVVTSVIAYDATSNITEILALVVNGAASWLFAQAVPTAAREFLQWAGSLVLAEDDYILADFTGTIAGDDIYLDIHGYKMLIAA